MSQIKELIKSNKTISATSEITDFIPGMSTEDIFALAYYIGVYAPFQSTEDKKALTMEIDEQVENPCERAIAQFFFTKTPEMEFNFIRVIHRGEVIPEKEFYDRITSAAFKFGTLCSAEVSHLLTMFCPRYFIEPNQTLFKNYLHGE